MDHLKFFQDIAKGTYNNPDMQKWKKNGGKVIGYLCPYVPEEIIMAAGMLPYRIRANESTDTSEGDRYMSYQNCTFCRHVADEAMLGKYNFLDGFIGNNGCDHMRRLSDVFRAVAFKDRSERKEFFVGFVAAPHAAHDEDALEYFLEELNTFKDNLESYFSVKITDKDLTEAIVLSNNSRKLLRALYDMRKIKNPPVSGAEALSVTVAYTCIPKDTFNSKLSSLLNGLNGRVAIPEYRKRIFLYGSELDNPEWVKTLEDQGALVVADGLCFGARMFWDMVDESLPPMEAIARRYYSKWACPRMVHSVDDRLDRIKGFVKDWKCDAIIGERMMQCQLWGAERLIMNLESKIESKNFGIPTLWLEREYKFGGVGQIQTRVQAFLENIE